MLSAITVLIKTIFIKIKVNVVIGANFMLDKEPIVQSTILRSIIVYSVNYVKMYDTKKNYKYIYIVLVLGQENC